MAEPVVQEKKGGRRRGQNQYSMDVDDTPEERVPSSVVDGDGEDKEEEETDFPDVALDELLEGFDEMTLAAGEHEEQEQK